jgi:hypothetical protein
MGSNTGTMAHTQQTPWLKWFSIHLHNDHADLHNGHGEIHKDHMDLHNSHVNFAKWFYRLPIV